jgi:hypothetical protein
VRCARAGSRPPGPLIGIEQLQRALPTERHSRAAQPDSCLLLAAKGFLGRDQHPCNADQPVRLLRRQRAELPTVREGLAWQHDPVQFRER